ncbi:MAG: winged helix-turn-helix domain-containing protein [Thermoanaerobaculales bacterium]|nr:winged helix-turn-helix domain-containing protein [Thermoanaerobaculales bacterium]
MRRPRPESRSEKTLFAPSSRPRKSEITGTGSFLLGECIVQPSQNKILIGNWVKRLEPRCMDLLVFFARHPLEVHPRERLIDEIWHVKAVATTTLTHAIAQIRQALGDDARRPRYIETIHRRGYRLVIKPEEVPNEDLVTMGDLTRRLNDCGTRDVLAFDNRRVSAIHEVRETRNGQRFGFFSNPEARTPQEIDHCSEPTELVFRFSIKLPRWFRSMLRSGDSN